MFIREFFAALYKDWIATVSGLASVVLAVWAALFSKVRFFCKASITSQVDSVI